MGVLKSLPLDKFHMTFANAIIEGVNDDDGATVEIFLDIYTQKLLWDVANILEGELLIKNVDKSSEVLPTIATCIGNIHLKRIVDHHTRSSDANDHYHTTSTADVMSRLLARFNCVARSKDLNPIKSSSRYVQKALQEAIGRLENEWLKCMDADKQKEEYKAVKTSAKEYIKKKHGIFALRIIESRWLHALLYVCSYNHRRFFFLLSSLSLMIELFGCCNWACVGPKGSFILSWAFNASFFFSSFSSCSRLFALRSKYIRTAMFCGPSKIRIVKKKKVLQGNINKTKVNVHK